MARQGEAASGRVKPGQINGEEPYLSDSPEHQGLILHSVYHRPCGWDFVPQGRAVPCGESTMWGDYHAREAALYVDRIAKGERYLTFFG